jgi:hypothetical protein
MAQAARAKRVRKPTPIAERRRARKAARETCKAAQRELKTWIPAERKRVAGQIAQLQAQGVQQIGQLRAQLQALAKGERAELTKRIKAARHAAKLGVCVDRTAGPVLRYFGPKRPEHTKRGAQQKMFSSAPDYHGGKPGAAYRVRGQLFTGEAQALAAVLRHLKADEGGIVVLEHYDGRGGYTDGVYYGIDAEGKELIELDPLDPHGYRHGEGRAAKHSQFGMGLRSILPSSVPPAWPVPPPRRSLLPVQDVALARQEREVRGYRHELAQHARRTGATSATSTKAAWEALSPLAEFPYVVHNYGDAGGPARLTRGVYSLKEAYALARETPHSSIDTFDPSASVRSAVYSPKHPVPGRSSAPPPKRSSKPPPKRSSKPPAAKKKSSAPPRIGPTGAPHGSKSAAADYRAMLALSDERKAENKAARARARGNSALRSELLNQAVQRGQLAIDWLDYFRNVGIADGLTQRELDREPMPGGIDTGELMRLYGPNGQAFDVGTVFKHDGFSEIVNRDGEVLARRDHRSHVWQRDGSAVKVVSIARAATPPRSSGVSVPPPDREIGQLPRKRSSAPPAPASSADPRPSWGHEWNPLGFRYKWRRADEQITSAGLYGEEGRPHWYVEWAPASSREFRVAGYTWQMREKGGKAQLHVKPSNYWSSIGDVATLTYGDLYAGCVKRYYATIKELKQWEGEYKPKRRTKATLPTTAIPHHGTPPTVTEVMARGAAPGSLSKVDAGAAKLIKRYLEGEGPYWVYFEDGKGDRNPVAKRKTLNGAKSAAASLASKYHQPKIYGWFAQPEKGWSDVHVTSNTRGDRRFWIGR